MYYTTPCHDRDDWFVSDNRGGLGNKSAEEREQDVSDSLRAKLICLTRCKVREKCMRAALSYEDNHHWIWGGYSGSERARIAEHGSLAAPVHRTPANFKRINEFIDYHLTRSEAAEMWGTTERAAESVLHRYIWDLRVKQGDVWVKLHDESLPESTDRVRAA